MPTTLTTPAFLIRRVDYGESDRILTFYTRDRGKISAIAKYAKKSRRRFAGALELFSFLDVVCRYGRRGGMPVLQEVSLREPFEFIRSSVRRTAYASYWSEIVGQWSEAGEEQGQIFDLLGYVFTRLNQSDAVEAELSILFQLRFMTIAGLAPNLQWCAACGRPIGEKPLEGYCFSLPKGGIVCKPCSSGSDAAITLSIGTVKQLLWVGNRDLAAAERVRFTRQAVSEGLRLLEAFVPYHLERFPKSLGILHQIRG